MNKLFKGAIAGAAGVALLLGGAGTFALWQDTTDMGTNATVTAGQLYFDPATTTGGTWLLNGTEISERPGITDVSDVRIVPGDMLTYRLDGATVVATGTDLAAELRWAYAPALVPSVDGDAASVDLASHLTASFTVDGNETGTIQLADANTQTFDIVLTLTFGDDADGLTAQGGVVNLSSVLVTLQQV